MKVIKVRKSHMCGFNHCCLGKVLGVGDTAVVQTFRKEGWWATGYYHPECYVQVVNSYVGEKRKELESRLEKKKKIRLGRGRPRKSNNPLQYRRLKALQSYYKKTGNSDRIWGIQVEIDKLL